MDIMNNEWKSLKDFDNQLLTIQVYKKHPSLLPYIGRHYNDTRILLLGESHYLDSEEDESTKKMENWYGTQTENYNFKWPVNLDTRSVVNNYLNCRRSKAHSMFRKPAEALIKAWDLNDVNDSEAFTSFAFMNYFQRPEANAGKSINLNEEDKKVACDTLNDVIKIIEPKLILFLSKKAYDSYIELAGDIEDKNIDYVYHPTSKFWNKDNGKDKAVKSFGKKRYDGYAKNGKLLLETIKPVLDGKNYPVIEKNHKRFLHNKTTVSIYPDKEDGYVSEIVWHVEDGNVWYGIGYMVARKTIWIWNYTEEEYMKENEMKRHSDLKDCYEKVCEIIRDLPE